MYGPEVAIEALFEFLVVIQPTPHLGNLFSVQGELAGESARIADG